MAKQIQIINNVIRYVDEAAGDVTAVPPGSEFISRATVDAACIALGITEEQLAQVLIQARGLVDERKLVAN